MTLEEKEKLIKSATSEEELEERMKQISEEEKAEEAVEEKEEVKEEIKEGGEITPEEERSLIKDSENIEQRNVQVAKPIERKEDFKMELKEFRNSKEYIDAYAEYIKTGDEKEVRTLLTSNAEVTGEGISKIQVPDFIDDVIRTTWEKEGLMSLVRKISVKGNFKVEFEVSGTPAIVHEEGGPEVEEEELVLGIVTLTPKSIKKWISISDEALDMRGEAFLRYIYEELTYRIAKKTADLLIAKIVALPQTLTPNADGDYDTVSADKVEEAPSIVTLDIASAHLSDQANDVTVVMNRLTKAEFTKAAKEANYPMNLFEGVRVVYDNNLPAYSQANAGDIYMVVGDFYVGAMANYPSGSDIEIKFDDKTLMTKDLVRILGRRFVGIQAVADKAFTLVAKPDSI